MANPPRRKGTAFENEVLRALQATAWPAAHRSSASTELCDIVGTRLDAVECKHRGRWEVRSWAQRMRQLGRDRWAIFVADGDRRKVTSAPDVVVVPADFALVLFECWERQARLNEIAFPIEEVV